VVAALAAFFIPPRTQRIHFDEEIYEGIGLSIAHTGRAAMVNDGEFRYGKLLVYQEEYNKQPNAWPYRISVVFRAFGSHEQLIFALCNLLFGLGAFTVFLIGWRGFGNPWSGVFAMLVYATIPINLQWANTTAVEVSAGVFAALTFLSWLLFAQEGSTPLLVLATALSAYAVQFRPESSLILPAAGVLLLSTRPSELKNTRLYICALLFFVLTLGHWMHLFAVRNEDWGSTGQKIATDFILGNLRINGFYFLNNQEFPVLYTLFAFAAIPAKKHLTKTAALLLWFLAFWGIFLFFYAGSYKYGADIRFSLLVYAPLAILAGHGISRITEALGRQSQRARAVALFAIASCFLTFLPQIRAVGEEAWAARADQRFSEAFAEMLPSDGIVYSHDPCLFHIRGKNAAQMCILTPETDLGALQERYPGGIYMHWGYWCVTAAYGQDYYGQQILDSFVCEPAASFHERQYVYTLYRLNGKKELSVSDYEPDFVSQP
jgi:hypothetical protein